MPNTYEEALKEHDDQIKELIQPDAPHTVLMERLLSDNLPDFVKKTVKTCAIIAAEMGRDVYSYNHSGFWVDQGFWGMFADFGEPNRFIVHFHVDLVPSDAAKIATKVLKLAEEQGMKGVIGSSYTFSFDEKGNWKETLFDEDAYDYAERDCVSLSSGDEDEEE